MPAPCKKVAALGYREVEAAGFYGHSAADVKAAMADAGLHCVSAHYRSDLLSKKLDEIIAFHKVLGAEYILCSYPGHKNPPAKGAEHTFSLEDWHWNAEQFNRYGAKVKAAGFRFGYHNHTPEFVVVDGVTPYDELMRLTDPALVTFEMDCGWVIVGGGDPVALLHKYPNRISMLHVKDFQPDVHAAARGATGPRQDRLRADLPGGEEGRDQALLRRAGRVRHSVGRGAADRRRLHEGAEGESALHRERKPAISRRLRRLSTALAALAPVGACGLSSPSR